MNEKAREYTYAERDYILDRLLLAESEAEFKREKLLLAKELHIGEPGDPNDAVGRMFWGMICRTGTSGYVLPRGVKAKTYRSGTPFTWAEKQVVKLGTRTTSAESQKLTPEYLAPMLRRSVSECERAMNSAFGKPKGLLD